MIKRQGGLQEGDFYGKTWICNENKKGQINAYRKKLGEISPELTGFLDRNEISNFSIWNAEDLIFGYYENQDNRCKGEGEKAEIAVLTEKIQDTFDWISTLRVRICG